MMTSSKTDEDGVMDVEPSESDVLQTIQGIKQELNFVRSALCLLKSASLEKPSRSSEEDLLDISELEENIDRLCIQDAAISFSLESETLQNVVSSKSLERELSEMLCEYSGNEIRLTTLSRELNKEYLLIKEAKQKCFHSLQKYVAKEREQIRRFQDENIPGVNDKLSSERTRKLKEIRFMQLIIPRVISETRVNFNEEKWLAAICRKVRDPILCADDLL